MRYSEKFKPNSKYILHLFLVSFLMIFAGCTTHPVPGKPTVFPSKVDSIANRKLLFAELRREMYSDPLYHPPGNPIAVCMMHEYLKVSFNRTGHWMIHGELNPPLTSSVLNYYTTNQEKNDLRSDAALYIEVTIPFLETELERVQDDIQASVQLNAHPEFIAYKKDQLRRIEKELNCLRTFGVEKIRRVADYALVEITYQDPADLPFPKTDAIDSVLTAFYMLRDSSAQKYFHRSYADLFYNRLNETSNRRKLEALETLHPIHVKDKPYFLRINPQYRELERTAPPPNLSGV